MIASNCGSESAIKNCLKECDNSALTDKQWLACKQKCNELTFNTFSVDKTPIGFFAIIEFATNPFNTAAPTHLIEFIDNSSFFIKATDPSFSFFTTPMFSEKGFYCYRYAVVIKYSDGSVCTSAESSWICNI